MTRSSQEPNRGRPLGEVVHYERNLVHDECLEQGTTSKEHGLKMQDVNRNTRTDYAALPRNVSSRLARRHTGGLWDLCAHREQRVTWWTNTGTRQRKLESDLIIPEKHNVVLRPHRSTELIA